jgi:hypothetical protein
MRVRPKIPSKVAGRTVTRSRWRALLPLLVATACETPVTSAPPAIDTVDFAVASSTALSVVTIAYGVVHNDSINVLAEIDSIEFTGAAGDVVTIALANGGAKSSCWRPNALLYSPSGVLLKQVGTASCGGSSRLTDTLPAAGTYSIHVRDDDGNATGRYGVGLYRVSPASGIPIAFGQVKPDSIPLLAEMDLHTITGTQGDVISAVIGNRGATAACWRPNLELWTANGTLIATVGTPSCGGSVRLTDTLPSTGTYVLLVRDDDFNGLGKYNLGIYRLFPTSGIAISDGQIKRDSITRHGEMDRFDLNGMQGQVFSMVIGNRGATGGCWRPNLELWSPTGARIATLGTPSCGGSMRLTDTLPMSGAFLLLVRDDDFEGLGRYNLAVYRLSPPVGPSIAYGQSKDGTIGQLGKMDRHVFSGTQGHVFTAAIGNRGATGGCWRPHLELWSSTGTLLTVVGTPSCGGSVRMTDTLPSTGKFLFVVRDDDFNGTGTYNLSLYRLSPPIGTQIVFSQTRSDSIARLGEMDRFIFSGQAGNVISATIGNRGATAGCWRPTLELWSATGALLNAIGTASCGGSMRMTDTLPSNGTFLLLVRDDDFNGLGRYNLNLYRLSPSTGTSIGYGQSMPDSVPMIGQLRLFQFSGAQNDAITIAIANGGAIGGCWRPRVELWSPTGALVAQAGTASCGGSTQLQAVVPVTGSFVIVVRDEALAGIGRFTVTLTSP